MKTVFLCVGFYGLGVFNCAVFAAVYLLHRPRYVAPTKRRKIRDRSPEVFGTEHQSAPPKVQWEARATEDESGVNYKFMGATGLEE